MDPSQLLRLSHRHPSSNRKARFGQQCLSAPRCGFVATACYWLSPAAILISAYHGNTDTAVAFFLLLSVWLATKQRIVSSGTALGASLWVKLPGILALPSLLILFRRWRLRGIFL